MADPQPILIVQQIKVHWTKRSRGSPGAARRNSVPEALPVTVTLPPKQKTQPKAIYHVVEYRERNDFQPTEIYLIDPGIYEYAGCTAVSHTEAQLQMSYTYKMIKGGAPARHRLSRRVSAELGQWAQVIENGRFPPRWYGDWLYQKVVTNAALSLSIEPTIFTNSPPIASYTSLEDLW